MYDEVGRVSFNFAIRGREQTPDEISALLGILPDYSHLRNAPTVGAGGSIVGTRVYNYWTIGSESRVESKSLDDHARAVVNLVLPLAPIIQDLKKGNEVYFFAVWESSRLVGGSGPIISPDICGDISVIGVELHFDIYCSLEHCE